MSQLVQLEGKHTTQNAHCAMVTISIMSNPYKSYGEGVSHSFWDLGEEMGNARTIQLISPDATIASSSK